MAVTSQAIPSQEPGERRTRRRLAPPWAHEAAEWILDQSDFWRVIGLLLAVIMLLIGGSLLFGGGYTSIQGVRLPLALLLAPWSISFSIRGLPSLSWWLIPLATNLIQIFARRIKGLRPLWWPSVIFDTMTTGVFIAYGLLIGLITSGFITVQGGAPNLSTFAVWGIIGTMLGFIVTIAAEQFFLAGLLLLKVTITGRR